ncbi:MAG: dienelactone hydrolase family protein [Acidiferrobacter sp.]
MLRGIMAIVLVVLMSTQAFAHKKTQGHTCRAFAGEFVQQITKSGRSFQVYRTGPPAASIGILLLPGASPLNESMLTWADRLGAQGYRVVAINLYGHASATKSQVVPTISQHQADAEDRAAIQFLSAPGRKIVTLGWGPVGALQSLQASAADPHDVSGTVLCNGGVSAPGSLLRRIKSLVLLVVFHSRTPLPKLQAFEARMRLYGKPLVVHYYDVSPKAADPAGPDFNSAIAQEIWGEARTFFRRVKGLCRRCAPYKNDLFDYHN